LSSAPVTSVGGGLDPRSNSPEYKATSTGLGERVQLASPEVDLETHITDVVHLIAFEDLHEVVLLGHQAQGAKVCRFKLEGPDLWSALDRSLREDLLKTVRGDRKPAIRLPVPPKETCSSFLAAFIGNSSLPFILSLEIENSPGKGGFFVADAFQSGYARQ
jgi:hypothetical protein